MAENNENNDSGQTNEPQYFAAKDAEDCANVLIGKINDWYTILKNNDYMDNIKRSWASYHGAYYDEGSHKISFNGTQGELTQLPVNHYRNIAEHLINIITANRPALESRAVNTDVKSQNQAILANGLLDYYVREKKLEKYLKTSVQHAVVLGEGYVKMEWNSTSGEQYGVNPDTNAIVYEGDVVFKNINPLDVIKDANAQDADVDWYICRSFKNKYDLIAKYPENKDSILAIGNSVDAEAYSNWIVGSVNYKEDTNLIPVYEFYHARTDSVPDGRYMLFVTSDGVLYDGPLPYRTVPLFRITNSDIIGTPFGYTSMFDLLPIQEAINMLYSVVATNQHNFGVQNILVPRGAGIIVNELSGGMNVIEYNAALGNGAKPEALNLTQTPEEIFKMIEMLERKMETISGVNQVTRGNPEASLRSAQALALVQSQTIQFISGLQQSYVALMEDIGTNLIKMLQDFATVPRVAAIVGRSNKPKMVSFSGDDLDQVNRVVVDVANPLSKTTAGRLEIAKDLLQMGLITKPEDYFTVLKTGNLDTMIEADTNEVLLIRDENEKMADGEEVPVWDLDAHSLHIKEHKALLSSPNFRKNADLVRVVQDHVLKHIEALQNSNPALLQLIGQTPLPPPAPPVMPGMEQGPVPGAPPAQQNGQQAFSQRRADAAQNIADIEQPLPSGMESAQDIAATNMPTPPAPFQNLPITPKGAV